MLHGVLTSFLQARYCMQSTPAVHSTEAPKGELLVALLAGDSRLWRGRLRPADVCHVLCLQAQQQGCCLAYSYTHSYTHSYSVLCTAVLIATHTATHSYSVLCTAVLIATQLLCAVHIQHYT